MCPISLRRLRPGIPHVVRAREVPEAVEIALWDPLAHGEAGAEVLEDRDLGGDVGPLVCGGFALVQVVHGYGGEGSGVEEVWEVFEDAHLRFGRQEVDCLGTGTRVWRRTRHWTVDTRRTAGEEG